VSTAGDRPEPAGAALGPEAIAAVDRSDLIGDIVAQPHQLADALWRAEAAGVPATHMPGGLVVCGMGGSAIGADLARAAIAGRAAAPLHVVRDYALPPWLGPDALVLCASYSGETEETLECFEAAGALGAPRVALTTGGELAARAREAGVPVIGVPAGFQPRAAVIYNLVGALVCAAACGAAPSLREEIEAGGALLTRLLGEWGPDGPDDGEPRSLARRLVGTVPVVFGSGLTVPVAARWKTQFNENPEMAAFAAALPEADHNEICAWGGDGDVPLAAVLLDDRGLPPRALVRLELTADAVGDRARSVSVVRTHGISPLERVVSGVLLGDLVTAYAAVLLGVDPTPVEPIERFKRSLAAAETVDDL
jgi:glucose/mannose-6-phosphate isomerase